MEESHVPECPYIERYRDIVRDDEINSEDLDFDTRLNAGCCIAACICPHFGGHHGCDRPVMLMNSFGLVYETIVNGVLDISHICDPTYHVCTDGGCIYRLFDDGRQRDLYESSEVFIEDVARRL